MKKGRGICRALLEPVVSWSANETEQRVYVDPSVSQVANGYNCK